MSNGRNFRDLLEGKWNEGKFLCIGLDTDITKIPRFIQGEGARATIVAFNKVIIDATRDIVCAYKPNLAFYEARGDVGIAALRETIMYLRESAPEVAVILDAKRGDIENTNEQYAQAAFEHLQADAITVHPYMGRESLEPFYARKEKGVIVLCHTSNPGAGEIQELEVGGPSTKLGASEPLYKKIARLASHEWNSYGNSCLMVGATYPKELAEVRAIAPETPILIAGVGAQEGSLQKTIQNGLDAKKKGLIVNAARSILYASREADFADVARAKAQELHDALKEAL